MKREDPDQSGKKRVELLPNFQQHFLTGLVTLVPVVITLWVVVFVIHRIGGGLARVLDLIPGLGALPYGVLTTLSFILLVILTYFVGLATQRALGTRLLQLGEQLIRRLPIIRSIYGASKQLTQTLFTEKIAFQKAVLIPFPHPGMYAIGFITSERPLPVLKNGRRYLHIFAPTTPNPTSGWYLLVPESDVIILDIPPEEALKMVVSGGIMTPLTGEKSSP